MSFPRKPPTIKCSAVAQTFSLLYRRLSSRQALGVELATENYSANPHDSRAVAIASALFTFFLVATLLCGCSRSRSTNAPAPPSVTVALPAHESVADYLELTGTVAPSSSVDLVARVSGYLEKANFKEGTFVEADQLLFLIEPEPYEQQLALAKAVLLRAQSEYDRQLELSKQNATSAAAVEKWLSERDQAAAQAELAKLNLGYTRVTAPFSGRIGRRFVDPGNLVGPNVNTKLATLDQLSPIYINFNLNERDALNVRDLMRQRGMDAHTDPSRIIVWVGLQNQEGYPHQGTLNFIDTGLNTGSGTILLRAELKNEDRALLPGLFARVRIPVGQPQPMLVIPASAIGNDQEGDYVLVVDAGDVAARRPIVKGPLATAGRAVRSGITASDRIIINGLMNVRPGARVLVVNAEATPDSASPTNALRTESGRPM